MEHPPPSPFFDRDVLPVSPFYESDDASPQSYFHQMDDAEDDIIRDEGSKKMFTREVKKDVKDGGEADYYNQWIMSNVG